VVSREVPLQANLFTGELVDNRTAHQKRRGQEYERPQQGSLFSQREMAQFGVEARPRIPLSPKTRIELALWDPRSDEERAQDLQRELEARTFRLLAPKEE
jgi:hypothetical protein